ncbi:protein N-terminal glutamine amidohydrolase-like isoform X2 [Physella acuta]|uniref:protein N-terminal glutamine amidohydrolase-like isoform X2 n=1 Tax=Physella acuta TaxID=109671 RepID=UPI0027DCFDF9|nr:protein N-terminal glutamine amidohydrolase-like isoform X2 [Physella acuta]
MTSDKTVEQVITEPAKCTYTSCYCEENIWKLCALIQEECHESELSKCYSVFISNKSKKIPLWHQKASKAEDRLIDYHVIMLYVDAGRTLVYDLDTELGFPCTLKDYNSACLGDERNFDDKFKRMFRVIPAPEFLTTFASDRSHMLNDRKEWLSPPPNYPQITCPGSSNNIDEFISMDISSKHGEVYHLHEFLNKFL